jgi:pteridine reductase
MSLRRTAIVTGGAKRVGRAIVESLSEIGFDVIFTTRASVDSSDAGKPQAANAGRVIPIHIDVADVPDSANKLMSEVHRVLSGRLDVLIHNASAYEAGDLSNVTLDQIRLMNRVHVETPMLLTQKLAPLLRASRGHVINMLDITADRPMKSHLAYCASKAALWNLTISLAKELAPEITVNGIAPGVVEWPDDMPPDQRETYLRRVPLGRAGTPDDVAKLVRYLITDGRYITGQVIRLDGGRSIA